MITKRTNEVFLSGHWSYQSVFTMKSVVLAFVLSAVTCAFGTWAIVAQIMRSPRAVGMVFFVGVLLCSIGLVAFVVGLACLWSFVVGKVDELEISDQGVQYGAQFWPWGSIAAIVFVAFHAPVQFALSSGQARIVGREGAC